MELHDHLQSPENQTEEAVHYSSEQEEHGKQEEHVEHDGTVEQEEQEEQEEPVAREEQN